MKNYMHFLLFTIQFYSNFILLSRRYVEIYVDV